MFLGHATDEMFVKYVEDNRILWDTRCSDYKDCKEKALVWDSVGANCGITGMINCKFFSNVNNESFCVCFR